MADKKPNNLFADLKRIYHFSQPADALFFNLTPDSPPHGQVKSLRILVPFINKEFDDNTLIGKDHSGLFYYNDEESLHKADYYELKRVQNPSDKKVCALVKFSATDGGKAVAEFLSYDPDGAVTDPPYSHVGKWKTLIYGNSAAATIQKSHPDSDDSNESDTLILDAFPIEYVAKLTFLPSLRVASSAEFLRNEYPAVKGDLFYKDLKSIVKSTWANFNNDRIIFYDGDFSSKDFNGFFVPCDSLDKIGKSIGLPPQQIALFSVVRK
jgi:hypothetical protein